MSGTRLPVSVCCYLFFLYLRTHVQLPVNAILGAVDTGAKAMARVYQVHVYD